MHRERRRRAGQGALQRDPAPVHSGERREDREGPAGARRGGRRRLDRAGPADGEDDETELSTDTNDAYAKVDVFLRESLRVVNDAIALAKDKQFAADTHAPLTALLEHKG